MKENVLTGKIIGAAIEVHQHLGPGLLESTYEECMSFELLARGLRVDRQLELPIQYKNQLMDTGYRIDLLVDKEIIVELKSVKSIEPIHEAQLLTYLKLSKKKHGLLFNFNVPVMKAGIRRLINSQATKNSVPSASLR